MGLILLGPGALPGTLCHQIYLGFSSLIKGDAERKLVPSACELMEMNLAQVVSDSKEGSEALILTLLPL